MVAVIKERLRIARPMPVFPKRPSIEEAIERFNPKLAAVIEAIPFRTNGSAESTSTMILSSCCRHSDADRLLHGLAKPILSLVIVLTSTRRGQTTQNTRSWHKL
jgi:hypothetical protein